ncbi:glycine cleavage system protein GcvH [Candidatus Micrarchaeota archaeon]|nr:glycine cleavage system protein GcvH [Candidatus Micrarchaeota archaeon]
MKFTKEHEWVNVVDGMVTVGISDFAQKALGDVVSVELPKVGKTFKQGESMAIVDSMKASSDVYAPLSGNIAEVNNELVNHAQWVNESPYEKGWMVKIKIADSKEMDSLMDETAYNEFCAKQPAH